MLQNTRPRNIQSLCKIREGELKHGEHHSGCGAKVLKHLMLFRNLGWHAFSQLDRYCSVSIRTNCVHRHVLSLHQGGRLRWIIEVDFQRLIQKESDHDLDSHQQPATWTVDANGQLKLLCKTRTTIILVKSSQRA